MLYNGSDVIRDVEWVIFDEIHYINDADVSRLLLRLLKRKMLHVATILISKETIFFNLYIYNIYFQMSQICKILIQMSKN